MAEVITAQTHDSEYLIHKYWSRKPANVIRELLKRHTTKDSIVLDPVCGSGVTVIEAAAMGLRAIGVDINPVAGLIARVSLDSGSLDDLLGSADRILSNWGELCKKAYTLSDGSEVQHCVHATRFLCQECGDTFSSTTIKKSGSRYRCSSCGALLSTSISNSAGTEVTQICTSAHAKFSEPAELLRQTALSLEAFAENSVTRQFDVPLIPNKRVLSYAGMTTASLFTVRNFTLLAHLADHIHSCGESQQTKNALLLLLTSAVASCSRLIPYRNNLKGGGPAWSVPGFWVPPMHLERNPSLHLRSRLGKLLRGLTSLRKRLKNSPREIHVQDSVAFLRDLTASGKKVDYIFADPPYGDSVPYLEFSQVWNCWLKYPSVDYASEIVVSDRVNHVSRWETYKDSLSSLIYGCVAVLSSDGTITFSFNNLDQRPWKALIEAVQAAGLWCTEVVYQLPAVVSAKAQFSPTGSYIGDIYATFRLASANDHYGPASVIDHRLQEVEELREGAISRVTHLRAAAITLLEQNVTHRALDNLDGMLRKLPAKTPVLPSSAPLFLSIRAAALQVMESNKVSSAAEIWAAVSASLPCWLAADQHEISHVLGTSGCIRAGRNWVAPTKNIQGELFDAHENEVPALVKT